MSGLRLGVDIGFKKISIALYENGVPRVLHSFPSVAACSKDHREWHFGMDARSFQADTNYRYMGSVKLILLEHGYREKNSLVSLLLEGLFTHIKMIGETERKQCLQGVVVVLSHCLDTFHVVRQEVIEAWQKNGVPDVFCISDVSAILLAYTVQTLDRQSLSTSKTGPVSLLVCNADAEHCRVDVFEVINNDLVVKFLSNHCVLWNCFGELRRRGVVAVHQQLKGVGMPELDQRSWAQLEQECLEQMSLFNDPRTDKVAIRAPVHTYLVTYTRETYHAAVEPIIQFIRTHVVTELTRIGIIDANTGNISGKVELLLVGENSRLGLLRSALESVTKSQVIAGVASYVDDAEAFGAAIASSLWGNNADINREVQLYRLQEGIALSMRVILKTLPVRDANLMVQPARDVFISNRRDFVLSGRLYMGDGKEVFGILDCRLVLSMQKIGNCEVHCLKLENNFNGQPVTYMRMLLGKDVWMLWRTLQRKRTDQTVVECQYLGMQVSFTYRDSSGCSNLGFFADDASTYKPFLEEYKARKREMLNMFPSASDGDKSLPALEWPSASSFVALVSDQLPTKHSHEIHKNQQHPSIVTVNCSSTRDLVVVVQQCQEVTGKLRVIGNTFAIERPHKIRPESTERDTIVIELTPQDCVRVSFPNEATRWSFLKKC
ncbi:uncharacterized protein LOC129584195 [Paramacrobiotus metropolitanus]|uniref:uncharacterized protein LOC129584195 n=1 Tax=Paramacrobiotus metropolitanus TaxID=2943436 RepID=UPI0024465B26|nr:uncharacterized protein LOC129584195 [Paramacrobiotus metropolitanus]